MTPVSLLVHVAPKRAERVWGEPLGGERFRLRSIPFLARGMSLGDVLEAKDGAVVRVVEKSGHATVRLTLRDFASAEEFARLWAPFGAAGCACESTSSGLIAVDVPPAADRDRVETLLAAGVADGTWELDRASAG